MQTLYGACRYCGEQRIVNAADQEDANNKVTNQCVCPDALFHKKKNANRRDDSGNLQRRSRGNKRVYFV